jgi:phosphoglycolate phosphatase
MQIEALLFDKDGTLFDFSKTWNVWCAGVIDHFADGDSARADAIAQAIEFDLATQSFLPTSPAIAGTNREIAELISAQVPGSEVDAVDRFIAHAAATAPLAQAVELAPFLQGLRDKGLKLGVMTNDTEMGARAHLTHTGVYDLFDLVLGADSGHGAKPDAQPLLAFANYVGIAPEKVAMVGDSTHDLIAGRAAGMSTIGVLTGMAGPDTLAPYANVVLNNVGDIPSWLGL